MVHWPETMVTWCAENRTLFSDDAFGALDDGIVDSQVETERFWDEMRRYYACIVGKYGAPVQKALRKRLQPVGKNSRENAWDCKKVVIFAIPNGRESRQGQESGRSSVRLEYTSGGRVVAGSNPVTPTLIPKRKRSLQRAKTFFISAKDCFRWSLDVESTLNRLA